MPEQQQKKCLRCKQINKLAALNCSRCGRPLFGPYVQLVTGSEDADNTTIPLPGTEPTTPLAPPSGPIVVVTPPSPLPAQAINQAQPPVQSPADPGIPMPPLQGGNGPQISRMKRYTIDLIAHHKRKLLFSGLSLLLIAVIVSIYLLIAAQHKSSQPTPTNLPSLSGIETKLFPNGEYVGVNDGQYHPFDMGPQRADSNCKLQAAQALQAAQKPQTGNNLQGAMTQWDQCLAVDTNDAEAKIYRENLNTSEYPHVTLLVGLDFPSPSQLSSAPDAIMSTRSALQGAYIAQEEFNDTHSKQHQNIRMRLLLVNTGDDKSYIPLVAQQIASIVKQDKTIVGILGWQTSANTDDMASDLYSDGVNIPIVSQTATYDTLNQASPHLFQIAPLNQVQAGVALTLTKMLHKTQAIVFMDPHTDLASQNLGADFKTDFTQAFPDSKLIEEDFTVDHTKANKFYAELTDALKQVQNLEQFVVFFACTTNYDTGQFQDALGNLRNYPLFPVIAGDAGYVAHPASYNRWYVLAYAFHDEYKTLMGNNAPFFQDYSAAFNANHQHNGWYGYDIPDAPATMTYDAASILSHSIDQALLGSNHQITSQEIEYQLGQTIWAGVSGQINLTPNNNSDERALIVLKVVQQVDQHGNKQTGFQMYCLHGTFSQNANNSIPAC